MIKGICINCFDERIDGRVNMLVGQLERAVQAGFDGYEFSSVAANVIRGGRVIQPELDRLKEILRGRGLHYTMHPPCELRLTDRTGMGRQVFLSCLEVCSQIGADVMVYHSAQIALRHADHDTAAQLPDAGELQEMWRYETAQLQEMAAHAAGKGVTIAVENRDPHLWELAALARHGKDASELTTYHAGMRLDLLARQVEEINLPNVGICLDVGHAHLAAPYWKDADYLTAVRQCAPWVRHVHFHDNFGRLDDWAHSMAERLVFGEADNHMPPGWGTIPLPRVLAALRHAGYSGWLVVEISSRYADLVAEVAPSVRAMVQAVFGG
jgi:sugar phosphate isomerase/epimerase